MKCRTCGADVDYLINSTCKECDPSLYYPSEDVGEKEDGRGEENKGTNPGD